MSRPPALLTEPYGEAGRVMRRPAGSSPPAVESAYRIPGRGRLHLPSSLSERAAYFP